MTNTSDRCMLNSLNGYTLVTKRELLRNYTMKRNYNNDTLKRINKLTCIFLYAKLENLLAIMGSIRKVSFVNSLFKPTIQTTGYGIEFGSIMLWIIAWPTAVFYLTLALGLQAK